MSGETRKRYSADRNPTNGGCTEFKEEWNEFSAEAKQHWEEAKGHLNAFGTQFSEKFNVHINGEGSTARKSGALLEISLPNGQHLSVTLGHLILFGLVIWWLPFNWLVLGGLVWLAYTYGNRQDEKPKHDGVHKPKRISKELADGGEDFDIYDV